MILWPPLSAKCRACEVTKGDVMFVNTVLGVAAHSSGLTARYASPAAALSLVPRKVRVIMTKCNF